MFRRIALIALFVIAGMLSPALSFALDPHAQCLRQCAQDELTCYTHCDKDVGCVQGCKDDGQWCKEGCPPKESAEEPDSEASDSSANP